LPEVRPRFPSPVRGFFEVLRLAIATVSIARSPGAVSPIVAALAPVR
jgi:hypothetical protein